MNKEQKKPIICVFAGSEMPEDKNLVNIAKELGRSIGKEGYDILYGGGNKGLMGVVAKSAQKAGAKVYSITMEKFSHEPQLKDAEIEVAADEYHHFKMFMSKKPVANFVLPGGLGTLREAIQHLEEGDGSTPLVLVQAKGFLDGIKQYLNKSIDNGFIKGNKVNALLEWNVGDSITSLLNNKPVSHPVFQHFKS